MDERRRDVEVHLVAGAVTPRTVTAIVAQRPDVRTARAITARTVTARTVASSVEGQTVHTSAAAKLAKTERGDRMPVLGPLEKLAGIVLPSLIVPLKVTS